MKDGASCCRTTTHGLCTRLILGENKPEAYGKYTRLCHLFMFVFFERNCAVENKVLRRRIGIDVVVSRASELQVGECRECLGKLLNEGLLINADAVGIEEGAHSFDAANAVFVFVLLDGIARIFTRPKASLVAHFGRQAVVAAQPVDSTLYFAVCTFCSCL